MPNRVLHFVVPHEPRPKQMGALIKGRVVVRGHARAFEDIVRLHCRLERMRQGAPILPGPVAVTLHAFVGDARTVDADNLAKCALDGLKREAFEDDRQVIELHVFKAVDRDRPRLEIEIFDLAPALGEAGA